MAETSRKFESRFSSAERGIALAILLAAAASEAGCATGRAWHGGFEERLRVAPDILETDEGVKDLERDPFLAGMIEKRGGFVGTFDVQKAGNTRTVRSYYVEMRMVTNADGVKVKKPMVVFADGTDATDASGDLATRNAAAKLVDAAKKEIPGFKTDADTRSDTGVDMDAVVVASNNTGFDLPAAISAFGVSVFVEEEEDNDITDVLSTERLLFYSALFSGLGVGSDSKSTGAMFGSCITITDHVVSGWDVSVDIFLGGVDTRISKSFSVNREDPAQMDAAILKIVEEYKYKALSAKEKNARGVDGRPAGSGDAFRGPVDMSQWSEVWIGKLGWQDEINALARSMRVIHSYKYGKMSILEAEGYKRTLRVEFTARNNKRVKRETQLEMQQNVMDDDDSKWAGLRKKYEEGDEKAGQLLYNEGARRRRIDLEKIKKEFARLFKEAAEEATGLEISPISVEESTKKALHETDR